MKQMICIALFCAAACTHAGVEDDIVLVGIDTLSRGGIANVISEIKGHDPSVIAIDVIFSGNSKYQDDLRLLEVLDSCSNVVMASLIGDFRPDTAEIVFSDFSPKSESRFLLNARTGFINAILENDSCNTLQRFSAYENVNGKTEYHFAIQSAMLFDSLRTASFLRNSSKIIEIKFRPPRKPLRKFTADEILNGSFDPHEINNKIVLIGFLGPSKEDMFFTPMNDCMPPYEPDMYGLEYLSYVVRQVLEFNE